ncbi:MAG: primosomal protein N', partial [Gammaproteobacteria bacterium]|nr:primosomal protein N' [Gammaproteobacteria bacterium]
MKIAIPIPLGHSFDYLPPATCDYAKLIPGCRIKVPFGARTVIGVLINTAKKASIPESRLKPALELLDQEPVLPQTLMQLNQWASDYYHHPIGEAMLNSLPKLLRDGKAATVRTQLVAPQTLPSPAIKLNSHQQKAVDIINSNTTFKVFLLDGVT